jgi:hypothetical protein
MVIKRHKLVKAARLMTSSSVVGIIQTGGIIDVEAEGTTDSRETEVLSVLECGVKHLWKR